MSTEKKLAEFKEAHLEAAAMQWDDWMEMWCESPIERLFLAAVLISGWTFPSRSEWTEVYGSLAPIYGVESTGKFLTDPDEGGWCAPQACIQTRTGKYRLDFAFVCDGGKIAVELDGHDFHEKTKAQAKKDKSRDRALTESGWRVLRFTGSEVYADVSGCFAQVMRIRRSLRRARNEMIVAARGGK